MATQPAASTPIHLWVVGILSLLWNCFGAYDYTMTELRNEAYLAGMGFGEAEMAYIDAAPAWMIAAWAIGVWVSLLGAILLLLRSRHAATAFLISLAGALVSFGYQFTSNPPPSLTTGVAAVMPVVILVLIVAQWYYARRMTAAGVLR
jgi:hypothetical protein